MYTGTKLERKEDDNVVTNGTYYVIRAVNELTVFEVDSLEEVMEIYKDGDIVAKKIPIANIPG